MPAVSSQSVVLRAVRYTVYIAWTMILLVVLAANLPESPLRIPGKAKTSLASLAPEGWAFFTRSPREPAARIYEHTESGWVPFNYANGDVRALFGIRRTARIVNVEFEALVRAIPETQWHESRLSWPDLVEHPDVPRFEVTNTAVRRRMCGEFLVVRQRMLPWAWRESRDRLVMPSWSIRVQVRCPESETP